ncbi:MAG: 50S ribosomal protein L10 [Rhabdochlamydiaceae bacterium]
MRKEKQLLLDEIKLKIDQSTALVLTSYKGFNPNMAADFRSKISQSGGTFEVVRKKVLIKAAEASGISLNAKELHGHIGVVFALQDPVMTTKALYDYKKNNQDVFDVLGGRFENQVCSSSDIEEISKLPSKDEMRAQLLAMLEAPMSQTLAVVEALLTSVLHCIENKVSKED